MKQGLHTGRDAKLLAQAWHSQLSPGEVSTTTCITLHYPEAKGTEEALGAGGIGWAAAFKLGKLITLLLTSSWAPPTARARPYASPFSRVMLFGPHFTGEETEAPRRAETCLESPAS